MKLPAPLQALALVAASFWTYSPALRGTWLWDDGLEIADNPVVHAADGWRRAWTGPTGLDYQPIKTSLEWLEWHLWGGHVLGYHLVNVALHGLGAILLWRLLLRLGAPWAWFGGLLFAVHPMAVESVAWIAEFKNVLSLPFLLGATCAFAVWDEDRSRRGIYAWAILAFLISLLCKPTGVMLPFCLLLLIWWKRGRVGWSDLRPVFPFFGLALAAGLVAVEVQWHRSIAAHGPPPVSAAPAAAALLYLRHAVLPYRLAPIYGAVPLGLRSLAWLAVPALLAILWRWRRGWGRHAALTLGWFVLHLLPVLGFVSMAYLTVSDRADHLAYISLAALCGGLAALMGWAWREGPAARPAWLGLAAALAAAFLLTSRGYAAVFRSELALWTYAASREPNAWLARANLGRTELQSGHIGAAVADLTEAVRLQPASAETRTNLAAALRAQGDWPHALAEYREAVRLDPGFAGAHYDLGQAWLVRRDFAAAENELRAAIRLRPDYAEAHNNLGIALFHQNRRAEALAEFHAALRSDPDLAEAHLNLGNAAFAAGDPERAAAEYRAALAIQPNYAAARANLDRVTPLLSLGVDSTGK